MKEGMAVLSPREREVAQLVAEGLTNKEIAERLVISERTAEGHVEQIRNKLGFRSRAQVAAWVVISRTPAATPVTPAATVPSISPDAAIPPVTPAVVRVGGVRGVTALRRGRLLTATAVLGTVAIVVAVMALRPMAGPSLTVVAGLGTNGFSGDGGPATAAQLSEPTSIVFGSDGEILFTDSSFVTSTQGVFQSQTAIRRIDRSGRITTIGGIGTRAPRDSAIIAAVRLPSEARMAAGSGGVLFTAFGAQSPGAARLQGAIAGHYVARIDPDGTFQTIAGADVAGYSGDGARAIGAQLWFPRGLAVGGNGTVYVADSGNSVIRAITSDGRISTVVGTGQRGGTGDGGPATAATLFAPLAVTLSSDGSLFIADTNDHRIRSVGHGGTVVAVGGDGTEGFAGDGGSATRAQLSLPSSLAFAPDGVLYIADTGNARVRAIRRDGTIVTVAGPPELVRPIAVAVDAEGVVFIGDAGAHRLFKIAPL